MPDWKAEAIRQWNANPCGAMPNHPFGSREFFRDVEGDEAHRVLRAGGEAIVALCHRDSAIFWWTCVLNLGVLRGGFWRDGYRKTLARVEYRAQEDSIPLVKVYSRRTARRLFGRFASADVSVHHLEFTHAGRLGLLVGRVAGAMRNAFSRWIGWYVMIRARK